MVKDLTASRWSKHRDGSWRSRLRQYGARGNAVPANVFGRIEKHLFRALLLNHLQTRRKPTGHWWVECGKEVVGKTVNSERARTDPVRTYVPGNGRQAPAKRAQTARVAPALHLLRLNLSPHYLADQCFYFKRSRGPGSRRGFVQGQS